MGSKLFSAALPSSGASESDAEEELLLFSSGGVSTAVLIELK